VHKNNGCDDFVESLGEMIQHFMDIKGNPHSDCLALSNAVKNQVREQYEGERIFIKKSKHGQKQRRDCIIKKEFNGQNAQQLMQRFGVSRATIYRIVNAKKQ